jgi:hypothetical protein
LGKIRKLPLAKSRKQIFNVGNRTVGWIAQSVEQRTENPCVAGSIPAPATTSSLSNRIDTFDAFLTFVIGYICGVNKISLGHFWATLELLNALQDGAYARPDHLQMEFQKTREPAAVVLGHVHGMTTDFKSTRYMEMKSIRERSSGIVNAHGEFKAHPLDTHGARRTALGLAKEEMDLHVNGPTGHLTYGPGGDRFFDQTIKVDAFQCTIDQANWCVTWSLSGSYTIFPDEDGYAAADVEVAVGQDEETGDAESVRVNASIALA